MIDETSALRLLQDRSGRLAAIGQSAAALAALRHLLAIAPGAANGYAMMSRLLEAVGDPPEQRARALRRRLDAAPDDVHVHLARDALCPPTADERVRRAGGMAGAGACVLSELLRNAESHERNPELFRRNFPFRSLAAAMWRDRLDWEAEPVNGFTRDGFEMLGPMLDAAECDRLVAMADALRRERSYQLTETAYFVQRADLPMATTRYDRRTCQFFNLQDVDSGLAALHHSGRIEGYFRRRLKRPITLCSTTLMISEPEGRSRQPWHVDMYHQPEFKLFIYLNDVDGASHGPLSVVAGSHMHVMRRWRARVLNEVEGRHYAQMELEYRDEEASYLAARKGHGMIATVQAVHAGAPQHAARTRYALAFYLNGEPDWRGPYAHGRETANAAAVPDGSKPRETTAGRDLDASSSR